MARLPTPGSDDGIWGNVLNDFLSQAHTTTGTLKDAVVPTNVLADGAVTAVKLSATSPTSGQVLSYNGSSLAWITPAASVNAINNQYTAAQTADYWINGKARVEDQTVLGGKTSQTQLIVRGASSQSVIPLVTLQDSASAEIARLTADSARNFTFGRSSMGTVTTGTTNTAFGNLSLQNVTTGSANTAVGSNVLRVNIGGSNNSALGTYALESNQTGNSNTAAGQGALQANTTGGSNVAVGVGSLAATTTGYSNIGVGNSAMRANTTGTGNAAIGTNSGFQDNTNTNIKTLGNLQNSTALGAYTQVTQNNSLVLGSVDLATKTGLGITSPQNFFSASPVTANSTTITATESAAGTVTATAAIFSAANVGDTIVWADGTTATITLYSSNVSVDVLPATQRTTASYFRVYKPGLQVTTSGSVGIGTVSPNSSYALDVNGAINATGVLVNGTPVSGGSGSTGYVGVNAQTGTTYTPVASDAGKLVTMTNAAAITVTLPSDTSLTLAVGSQIDFAGMGAGKITFAAGSGATANATPSLTTRAQYSVASAIKYAANSWLVVGDLA